MKFKEAIMLFMFSLLLIIALFKMMYTKINMDKIAKEAVNMTLVEEKANTIAEQQARSEIDYTKTQIAISIMGGDYEVYELDTICSNAITKYPIIINLSDVEANIIRERAKRLDFVFYNCPSGVFLINNTLYSSLPYEPHDLSIPQDLKSVCSELNLSIYECVMDKRTFEKLKEKKYSLIKDTVYRDMFAQELAKVRQEYTRIVFIITSLTLSVFFLSGLLSTGGVGEDE